MTEEIETSLEDARKAWQEWLKKNAPHWEDVKAEDIEEELGRGEE